MTKITFYTENGVYRGFSAEGHAGFKKKGEDIVCAAISVLITNTVNALETITCEDIEVGKDDGYLVMNLKSFNNPASQVLMKTLALGVEGIQKEYGKKYCTVVYKEENANVKA